MATPTVTPSIGMQDFFTTTLSGSVAAGDTTINLAAVPSSSEGFLVIDPNNATTREIIYYNSKGASSVTCPSAALGRGQGGTSAQAHSSSVTVQMNMNSQYWTELQNGDANSGMNTRFDEATTDFVSSGLVWSGDSYGGTLNGSMTSGKVYVNGIRITMGSVSAHTFTASKDTYVDILSNGDNTGTVVYTAVSNNAASPALASNSIRIAIIITGAGNIANASSVNQGQASALLPIASSQPYEVTDSLGNLICNRSSNAVVIGYRSNTSNQTGITTATDVTGLSCPVIVPANRKVRVSCFLTYGNATGAAVNTAAIMQDGTTIQSIQMVAGNTANGFTAPLIDIVVSPTTGSHTYKAQIAANSGTVNAFADGTSFWKWIKVEVV